MLKQRYIWWAVIGAALLLLLALNFVNFRVAHSATETNHTLSTYRTGETLPQSMSPPFYLSYAVTGGGQLAEALAAALEVELEEVTAVDTATILADPQQKQNEPILLVDLASDRLWTPVYGRSTVKAQLFYAYDGDAPWPLDEPVVFRVSPAVKADGQFTVDDTSWGLLSKPAYDEHLAQALAETIASALQDDVFER